MQALDQTIANVALPYMQGSLSASFDEITWVLTSYITAAAIMTAPVGWLAARFGRKYLFIACLTGFTITSMLCGAAQSLDQMVMFRLLQGMFGAALVPLSQATMLDIYPVEQRGTRHGDLGRRRDDRPDPGAHPRWLSDRDVQLALRLLHQSAVRHPGDAGADLLHAALAPERRMRFDWIGFAALGLGIGAIQMMLDRGQDQDWFTSREIIVEAVLGGLGIYLFVVHMLTARRPFIPPALFKDRNFAAGVGDDVRRRHHPGVQLVADGAMAAESGELSGGYRRADHGAARHRHDDRHGPRRSRRDPRSMRGWRWDSASCALCGRSGK